MVRVVNADPKMGTSLTEGEAKEFMTNRTILHLGTVDSKGEPSVTPVGYYFDSDSNKIYIPTHKNSKKVRNLSNNKIVSFVSIILTHLTRELDAKEKSAF